VAQPRDNDGMSAREYPYSERVVSWTTVWDGLYPEDAGDPHDDEAAAEMHRLRGLVMAQAAETESVLGQILKRLDPRAKVHRPAGNLLRDVKTKLNDIDLNRHEHDLGVVDAAIRRRNWAVHSVVTIGSSWVPYSGGGGEWQPVISLLGTEEYNESDLMQDLVLQQEATAAAVRVLHECSFPEQSGRVEPTGRD
jgi:hypothetical protein